MSKMNPKQKVSSGVDLMTFVQGADPQETSAPKQTAIGTKRAGRPPNPVDEVRNKNLQIKLTEAEYNALKDEAGRIPLAVYIRDKMKDHGII